MSECSLTKISEVVTDYDNNVAIRGILKMTVAKVRFFALESNRYDQKRPAMMK